MNLPGFKNWQQKTKEDFTEFTIARIISVNKTNYKIITDGKELLAELSGKLLYAADNESELPVTGDFVKIDLFDDLAIIHEILPRFSELKRKSAGKKIDFQYIASNIDFAFVIQAADTDFNIRRLERYLTMIYQSDIIPVLILTKTDLINQEELSLKISEVKNIYNELEIIHISNISGDGIENIKNFIMSDKTYCLIGSSGVGKSSLVNNLFNEEILAVNEVRESDKKGKHTTTRRELLILPDGGIIIDTPGMRELANFDVESGLSETFSEIEKLISKCKFSDCNHISDKGCALLEAVEDGEISEDRYNSFIKLKKENEYYESSYLEKKKKDKDFGKMVKSVMKSKVRKGRED